MTRYLAPPTFADEEKTRTAGLVNGILLMSVLFAVLFGCSAVVGWFSASRQLVVLICIWIILVSVGMKVLLHRGHVRLAASLASAVLWVSFVTLAARYDGIRDMAMIGCLLIIVITSLTLGLRAMIATGVLTGLVVVAMYAAERQGFLTSGHGTLVSSLDLVTMLLLLSGTSVLSGFAVHSLAAGRRRLRDERDRAHRYLDLTGTMMIALDADRKVTLVNRAGCKVLCTQEADALGQDWFETFVPEHDRADALVVHQALMSCEAAEGVSAESAVLNSRGEVRLIAWHHTAVRDAHGTCIGTLSSGEDVTDQRQADRVLMESHERFVTVLDSIDADVYVADLKTYEVLFMNRHMQASFGGDFVGRICYEVFRGESERCQHCTIDQLVDADGNPTGTITWEGHNPVTGRWYINHDRAIKWVDGRLAHVQVATDITAHREADAALRASEARNRAILSALPDLMFVYDCNGTYLDWHAVDLGALFAPPERFLGKRVQDVLPRDLGKTTMALIERTLATGVIQELEYHLELAGELRFFEARLAPYEDDKVLSIIREVTDRKRSDAATVHSRNLLLALSEAAQDVQRARTPEAVYKAVGDRVAALGLDAVVLTVGEDLSLLALVYMNARPDLMKVMGQLLGVTGSGHRAPLIPGTILYQAVFEGETFFDELNTTSLTAAVPGLDRSQMEPLVKLLRGYKWIVAPFTIGGQVQALLATAGRDLTRADVPALTAFANQAAIAIENARLYRETQHLAAFNRRIIESMVEGLTVQDADGYLTFANPAAAALLGYSLGELTGLHWTTYTPPDQHAVIQAADERRKLGEADRYALELIRKDGSRRSALVSGSPLFDDVGSFVGTTAVFNDVTEQLQAQEALQRSEQFLQDVFDAIRDGISVLDTDFTVVRTNAWMEEMYAAQMPLVGKKCFQAYQRRTARCSQCPSLRTMQTGERHTEIVAYRPTAGEAAGWLELTAFPIKDGDGRVTNVIEYVKDVTDRELAERERARLAGQIREQANQMAQILATVPVGVLLLEADGRLIEANPIAQDNLEVLARAVVGERLANLGDRSLAELLTSPPTIGLRHEVRADARIFEVIACPVERGSEPEHWVLVLTDVTREREIREELHQQERLAAVGQLAAGIAHDFNNILATIVLYAQMAYQASDLPDTEREKMGVINQQARHATRLIEQILDFSRRSVLERLPLDLVPLLKEHIKLLERTLPENIRIETTYGLGSHMVNADPTRMRQMFANLALNARDAMPDGGTLHIGLERVTVPEGTATGAPRLASGTWVLLRVSDTGSGIAVEALPHIFEPFFTTKAPGQGSGLGLAQVDGIVGQHGGKVDVESQVGVGTTFRIYLPALAVSSPKLPSPEANGLQPGRGDTILIVEDNVALREAFADALAQINYRVLSAANGLEALKLVAEHPEIGLVLSDLVMPEMGGQALFHALRERGVELPMILLSGHPMEQALEDLREHGLIAWMSKPPDMGRLSRLLASILEGD